MKTVVKLLMLWLAVFFSTQAVNASDVSPDYPGLNDEGSVTPVAVQDVQSAIKAFCKVFERLPVSWQEVEVAGIVDKELLGFNMEVIDPDDGRLDFFGDIYMDMDTLKDKEAILLFYVAGINGINSPTKIRIDASSGYSVTFDAIENNMELSEQDHQILNGWRTDTAQLTQFGHIHQFYSALLNFRSHFGYFPESLNDLVDHGFGPMSSGSINPVTGVAYRYDSSEGDILYEKEADGTGFKLAHVNPGVQPSFFFSY